MNNIGSTSSYGVGGSSSRGIPGMASGMDTESMVEKMLAGTQSKIDKESGRKQTSIWKQNMYRDIISKVNKFNTKYFDYLSSGNSNLSSSSFYNAMKAVSNATAFRVSGSSTANVGNTKISVEQLASASRFEGKSIASSNALSGDFAFESNVTFAVEDFSMTTTEGAAGSEVKSKIEKTGGNIELTNDQVTRLKNGEAITIEFDYTKTTTKLDADGNPVDPPSVVKEENQKETFDIKIEDGKLTIDSKDRTLAVAKEGKRADGTTSKTSEYGLAVLGLQIGSRSSSTVGSDNKPLNTLTSTIDDNVLPKIDLTLDGIKKTFEIPNGMTNKQLQEKLDFAFGKGTVTLKGENGAALAPGDSVGKFELSTSDGRKLSASGSKLGLEVAGVRDGESNKVAIGDTLENALKGVTFDADGKAQVKIGDTTIEALKTDTISSFMKKVNSSGADVKMDYISDENRFVLLRKSSGAGFDLNVTDDADGLLKAVMGDISFAVDSTNDAYKTGTNAQITVNGKQTERSENNFTINGLNIELLEVSAAGATDTITTTRDTDQIFNGIKSFVDDYNSLIKELNELVDEDATYKDYAPLTESQKKDMSKSEIDAWEKKAQEGLLRGDSEISTMLSELRLALYQKPATANLSMFDIGIETSKDWKERGKLEINEDTLKRMINSDAAGIQELFTFSKTKEVINSKGEKEIVPDGAQGIATAFKNIIKKSANTSLGSPGSLVRIAGVKGMGTDKLNTISEQTAKMTDRIKTLKSKYEKEKARYWNQFNTMEKVIANLSAQSGWLTQQFGG